MSTLTARMFPQSRQDETNETNELTPGSPEVTSLISSSSSPWPVLDGAALDGPAGEFVRLIEPHTEADTAAILTQFLVLYGSAVGRTPYYEVEADQHRLNEFLVLVGPTSEGRKGTSLGHPRRLLAQVDADWAEHRQQSGLSSGEGLVWAVRDPIEAEVPVKVDGRVACHERVVKDAGIADKRLCVIESEFVSVIRTMRRDGNVLSPVLRQAWDSGNLRTLTKNSPASATGAHISIIGHITAEELTRELQAVDLVNGFLNRFVLVCVRRARYLPDGGDLDVRVLEPLARRLEGAVAEVRRHGRMRRDPEARALWHSVYPALTKGRPGMVGALRARAAAHVLRFSCLYAALEGSAVNCQCARNTA